MFLKPFCCGLNIAVPPETVWAEYKTTKKKKKTLWKVMELSEKLCELEINSKSFYEVYDSTDTMQHQKGAGMLLVTGIVL